MVAVSFCVWFLFVFPCHLLDVFLSTITDCLEAEEITRENEEDYVKFDREKREAKERDRVNSIPPAAAVPIPLSVISAAIGEITAKDIMIAGSANGE